MTMLVDKRAVEYISTEYTVYTHSYTIYLLISNAIEVYGTHIHSFWYGSHMLYFLT